MRLQCAVPTPKSSLSGCYPDPLGFGGIISIGSTDDGALQRRPGAQPQVRGSGAKLFAASVADFLYVLEAIVEIQHLHCTCVTMIGIV